MCFSYLSLAYVEQVQECFPQWHPGWHRVLPLCTNRWHLCDPYPYSVDHGTLSGGKLSLVILGGKSPSWSGGFRWDMSWWERDNEVVKSTEYRLVVRLIIWEM